MGIYKACPWRDVYNFRRITVAMWFTEAGGGNGFKGEMANH